MGWRQGKGVGAAAGAARQEERYSSRRGGWGDVAGVGPENTPLHLVQPKHDVYGIGYDPFKGAEEFRAAAKIGGGRHPTTAATGNDQNNKRRRGVAFGTGVLDEDDTFGMMEDYVTHDDVESYEEIAGVDQEGLPQRRGPKLDKQNLGDRLALQGFAYEVQDEEESDEDQDEFSAAFKKQKIYQLTGSAAPLLLKNYAAATEMHEERQKGLIPGFVLANKGGGLHKSTYYPPPNVPEGYIPVHRPNNKKFKEITLTTTAAAAAAPLEPVPAPDNEVLRQAIERLAFFVARNGPSFEILAREQQQRALDLGTSSTSPLFSFLLGGPGAQYYLYKRASLLALLAPRGHGKVSKPLFATIGQRSAPLTAEDRGAMLGEQPLPGSISTGAGGGGAQKAPAPAVPLARSILNLAEEDRKRLAAAMGSIFVRAETVEDRTVTEHGVSVGEQQAGLRPGVAPVTTTIAAAAAAAGLPGDIAFQPQKPRGIITREDLIQSTGRPMALQTTQQGQSQQPPALPVRKSKEWRPEPLLCKRLDVPDPYRGKPKEIQMSRFRTDHVALPATVEALGRAAAAAAPSGADFLLPPAVRVAVEEAKATAARLATSNGAVDRERVPLPPPAIPPPLLQQHQQQHQLQQQQPEMTVEEAAAAGAGEAAEAFLSSLFGQAPKEKDHDKAEEEEVLRQVATIDKPVDLFKAIFEDSDDEEEEEDAGDKKGEKAALVQQKQQQTPPASIKERDTEFGFEKFRGGGSADGGRGHISIAAGAMVVGETSDKKKVTDNFPGLESLDPGMRSRVEAAFKVLKDSKKKHKRTKKKKRKKEWKDKDASSSKRRKRDKERKNKRRRSSDSSGDTSGSDSESV
jgi:G patch domain-containing protein 1